jgi:hypothetical protein
MIHKSHEDPLVFKDTTWRLSGGQPDHEQSQSPASEESLTPTYEGIERFKGTPFHWDPEGLPTLLEPPVVKDHSPVKTYDVRECQLILHLSKGKTHQFIRQHLLPIPGAVALVGRKYLVHQWALNHALLQRSVSPGPTNPKRVAQMSRARSKQRGQSPLTSSETPSTSSGEKSSI